MTKVNIRLFLASFLLIVSFLVDGVLGYQIIFPGRVQKSKNVPGTVISQNDLSQIKKAVDSLGKRNSFSSGVGETKPTSVIEEARESTVSALPKVKILNGSGISGAAKKLKDQLERDGGITVVSLGNIDESPITIIKAKSNFPLELKRSLIDIVKLNYFNIEEEVLPDGTVEDMIITLGKP